MKILKDCDVEPGDIIQLGNNYMYECLSIPRSFYSSSYKWKFKCLKDDYIFDIDLNSHVKQIIKKDPKKEILQKIEEHKSEIQSLENQLKDMNSLKVGEVYRVTEESFKDGIIFFRGEILYLEYNTSYHHIFRSNKLLTKSFKIDSAHPKLELVNDPEMKNGLAKFFKGNS